MIFVPMILRWGPPLGFRVQGLGLGFTAQPSIETFKLAVS